MIGQPLGCILSLCIGVLAVFLSYGAIWSFDRVFPGIVSWGFGALSVGLCFALVLLQLLMDAGHRLEIVVFFRRRKIELKRIQGFRNHYRVHYVANGKKVSGKWPKDFESWLGNGGAAEQTAARDRAKRGA
jgi:hypothetical protein